MNTIEPGALLAELVTELPQPVAARDTPEPQQVAGYLPRPLS